VSLIFITGVAGSGKSAIRKELSARGYEAYDTDKDGLSEWFNKDTGKSVYSPREEWGSRSAEWYAKHELNTSLDRIRELATQAKTKVIFLCGSTSNRREVMKLCSLVVGLDISEEVLRQRIAARKNLFGKQQHELDKILEWRKKVTADIRRAGAIIIDANRPLEEVVDDVVKVATENN
jgi:shikimate kinase